VVRKEERGGRGGRKVRCEGGLDIKNLTNQGYIWPVYKPGSAINVYLADTGIILIGN